jgi:hypothetical protein
VEEAMKLGTLASIAALAMAMTLGVNVSPADAGDKARKIHVSPHIKDETLRKAAKTLKGEHKKAVLHELNLREQPKKHAKRREDSATRAGKAIGSLTNIEGHIVSLGVWSGTFNKRNHNSGH